MNLKVITAIFVGLTLLQILVYQLAAPENSFLQYPLMPGWAIFVVLPVSPEIVFRHHYFVILPVLANAAVYTALFFLIWILGSRLTGKIPGR
jgi:hypothetical protein